jgi:uncharacterized protein (TIGR02246 family)
MVVDIANALDETAIRAAERTLEQALAADDPTAWVYEYTEDAVFDGGDGEVIQGRPALLAMARAMTPITSASIKPLRTEGCANLAAVWFEAAWVNGPQDTGSRVEGRGVMRWRKESDGHWRVAIEHIAAG